MKITKYRIVICDDESGLRRMLNEHLTECGYLVLEAENANELQKIVALSDVDLIVLDVRMPGIDGFTALRELRIQSTVPVIMLTSAGDVIDKVLGLELGADDYIVKPVDLRELQARIKSTIRRIESKIKPFKKTCSSDYLTTFGECYLDIAGSRLIGASGDEVAITAMEFRLLKVFSENKGRILNRDQLLEQTHNKGWDPFDRSIDLRISRLRRKIEQNPQKPKIIQTVYGIGYVFK